jgi:hypothetical protein
MPATLKRPGRKPNEAVPDTGCRFAPRCRDCWIVRCYYSMDQDERRAFTEALAAIRPWVRAPDG